MYNVTLVHLARDAKTADAEIEGEMRYLSPAELGELLETFRKIDPMQNASADPEIRINHRRDRYIIRTGQGKLMLYDGRDNTQPALVLTAEAILAELDGTAAAARVEALPRPAPSATPHLDSPAAIADADRIPYVPPPPPPPRRALIALLSVIAIALAGGIAWLEFSQPAAGSIADFTPQPAADRAATAQAVEGVYVTGSEPGSRGLVIGLDGAIRIFQLNAGAPPSSVQDTWRSGRRGPQPVLALAQLGTIVEIVDPNTVSYCGELYRRAAPP